MSAWTTVFAAHAAELRAVLARVLGDAGAAEDCVQDTAMRLLDQPFDGVREPKAFMFQVGYNLARDVLRRRSVRAEEALETSIDGAEISHEGGASPETLAQSWQQLQSVQRALDAMPEQRRRVLWLMRVEGLSQKEVAAELSISPKTVENHMTQALKQLAALMRGSRG